MVLGILGGISYLVFRSYVPQSKKVRNPRVETISEPVGTVKATGAGGYQGALFPIT